MRVRTAVMGTLMLLPLILLAPVPVATQTRVTVAVTGPGPGFFAFDLMNGFAPMLPRDLTNVTVVAERSPNFLDTMQRIVAKRADVGIVGGVIVLDASLGQEEFRGGQAPVRTLALLHDFVYYFVTLEDSGIRAIGDLRGKRVGIAGPGDVRDALRWLRSGGIDPQRDVRVETSPVVGAWVPALLEKKIDAAFMTATGWPTHPDVWGLANTPGVRMRLVPLDAILPAVLREFGARYRGFTIQKGLYPGMTTDVRTISSGAQLIALEGLDENLAYQITKTFYERRGELAQFSLAAQYITLTGLAGRSSVPFHQGAVRYFRERNVPGF